MIGCVECGSKGLGDIPTWGELLRTGTQQAIGTSLDVWRASAGPLAATNLPPGTIITTPQGIVQTAAGGQSLGVTSFPPISSNTAMLIGLGVVGVLLIGAIRK